MYYTYVIFVYFIGPKYIVCILLSIINFLISLEEMREICIYTVFYNDIITPNSLSISCKVGLIATNYLNFFKLY